MTRWAVLACLLALMVTSAPAAPAWAQGSQAERVAEAKRLFKAGARAYQAGKLDLAIQAFEQAYELAPRPALRFSTAQALRRKHGLDPDPQLLHQALAYFREYLAAVPEGGRRLDALKAVSDLQLLLAHQGISPDDPEAAAGGGPAGPQRPGRQGAPGTLSIEPSVPGATASVDGQPPVPVPAFIELPPGLHRVVISAPGYVSLERQVSIVARGVRAIDEPLIAKPATLTIGGFAGADVLVDGRPVGRTPTARPLSLPSGPHRVVVGHSGYQLHVEDLDLERGENKDLPVDLSMTPQRVTAWILFGGAGLAAIAGGVLVGLMASEYATARDLDAKTNDDDLTVHEMADYNEAINDRDRLRIGAVGTLGGAGLAVVLGLLLYTLDEPSLYEAAAPQQDAGPDEDAPGQPPVEATGVTARIVPLLAVEPTVGSETTGMAAGLMIQGRF